MPVYRLDEELAFPPPHLAEDDGLLAVGGDLSPERLLLAYSMGIFPWFNEGMPILWHSPDPRFVLDPARLHVNRTLRKELRKHRFEIRLDTAFAEVIEGCSEARRNQQGTWITDDMLAAYIRLHELGFAHSAEAWLDGELVGGLYGVSLGRVYFGESMFTRVTSASKVAFVTFVEVLRSWDFELIDCQVHTELLESFGAEHIPRRQFLTSLEAALDHPTKRGRWHMPSVSQA